MCSVFGHGTRSSVLLSVRTYSRLSIFLTACRKGPWASEHALTHGYCILKSQRSFRATVDGLAGGFRAPIMKLKRTTQDHINTYCMTRRLVPILFYTKGETIFHCHRFAAASRSLRAFLVLRIPLLCHFLKTTHRIESCLLERKFLPWE